MPGTTKITTRVAEPGEQLGEVLVASPIQLIPVEPDRALAPQQTPAETEGANMAHASSKPKQYSLAKGIVD